MQTDDQAVKEMDIFGEVHIIDRTLTLGSVSASTFNEFGVIRFRDLTSARPSILYVHNNTTMEKIDITTDAGKVGLVMYANAKTDTVTIKGVDVSGSVHWNINSQGNFSGAGARSTFSVSDPADELLIGPDADPDPNDANFNAFVMAGDINFSTSRGVMRFQRMDMNGVAGTMFTGRSSSTSISDLATTEFRYYADESKLTAGTSLNFSVFEYGVLDIKPNLGAVGLRIQDNNTNAGTTAVVKLASGRIARFEPN